MIKAEITGDFNIPHPDFIETLGAKSVSSASHRFVEFLKNRRFYELFNEGLGLRDKKGMFLGSHTVDTIDTYRFKGKHPTYVVKAGVGITGNLNYLAGLYSGRAVSKSGKVFSYARKRDLINDGWKAWGGEGKLEAASEEQLEKMIAEAEKRK
jgi:hypothetical protein